MLCFPRLYIFSSCSCQRWKLHATSIHCISPSDFHICAYLFKQPSTVVPKLLVVPAHTTFVGSLFSLRPMCWTQSLRLGRVSYTLLTLHWSWYYPNPIVLVYFQRIFVVYQHDDSSDDCSGAYFVFQLLDMFFLSSIAGTHLHTRTQWHSM